MKKIISLFLIICSVVLLASCNVGQSENESSVYKSYVTNVANDGLISIEKDWWSEISKPDDSTLPQTRKVVFGDVEYTVEYDKTYLAEYCSDELVRYINEDIIFSFDKKSGNLQNYSLWEVTCKKEYYMKSDMENPREYADDLAEKVAKQYIDITEYFLNVSERKRTLEGLEYIHYYYTYTKMSGDYATNDSVNIEITSKGDLISVTLSDIGRYDDIDVSEIDTKEVEKSVSAKIKELYGEKYSYTYDVFDQPGYDKSVLCSTPEGNLAISSFYEVVLTKKDGEEFSTLVQITTCLDKDVKSSSNKSIEFQDVSSSN